MINSNEEFESKRLRDILKMSGKESPSAHFTERIMENVKEIEAAPALNEKKPFVSSTNLFIGTSVLLALMALLYFFYQYGDILLVKDFDPVFSPVIKDLYKNLEEIISAIKISSITLVIISGFLILLFIEYFFNKSRLFKNFHFSF